MLMLNDFQCKTSFKLRMQATTVDISCRTVTSTGTLFSTKNKKVTTQYAIRKKKIKNEEIRR